MQPRPKWDDENVAMLKKLWAEGVSAEQCSQRMGFTRNAILGKVDRLGLPHRKTLNRASKAQLAERGSAWRGKRILSGNVKSALTNLELTKPKAPEPLPVIKYRGGGVPLIDRGPDQCAFPINNAGRFELHLFCGKPRMADSPYCRECRAKMFVSARKVNVPFKEREREAA